MPDTPLELTNAEWQTFQSIPDQGYSHRAWVDARIAERLTVAQSEVQRKLAISVKALGLVASLHTPVESIELGQECRICSIPYPCMTRRVADEALQAIERKVNP